MRLHDERFENLRDLRRGPWDGGRRGRGDFPRGFPPDLPPDFRGRRGGPRGGPHSRRQRGDIRTALLALLAEGPGHGYDLIGRLDERSGGSWRPSPGSVYPTLQMLEDEGFARSVERDGKRVYEVTDEGRAESTRRIEAAGGPPWERTGADTGLGELRDAAFQLGLAVRQLGAGGTTEQVERAAAIVNDARKQIYRLLAED
jgi:DNA-binding PadR family transcriptional regulator